MPLHLDSAGVRKGGAGGPAPPPEMVTAESARPRDLAAVFPSAPCALFALNVCLFSKSFFYFEITTESQEVAKKGAGSPVGPPGPRRPAWRRPAAGGWDSGLDLLTVPRPRAQTGVRRGAFLARPGPVLTSWTETPISPPLPRKGLTLQPAPRLTQSPPPKSGPPGAGLRRVDGGTEDRGTDDPSTTTRNPTWAQRTEPVQTPGFHRHEPGA